ncbi:high mobility group B protein 6-like isoform X2 [Durio zibethinus]|uniref:High mobility group B protein 6-like isoform X2 n=1 Tax=Durio zibethinus TaxID=66656 RepID=A0A6P5YCB4_DURZI|nr:high mobility group B protein 6-like isoform X2 [Durio zibethinus]
MADTAVVDVPKKSRNNGRKALKQKNPSTNDANILAQKLSQPSPTPVSSPMEADPYKENHEVLSQTSKRGKAAAKGKQSKQQQQSFEKELQEMQEMVQKLRIEKEKTEELLKEKDEMLKLKEEELETKGKDREKLQIEFKKLQKIKEFKPTMTFPIAQSQKDKKQNKKEKKKKEGGPEKKRPSPPYILWCKDQWNEVKKENPEADFKEVSNILGAKWKTVTTEEKKPYEEKYQAQKEAYLQLIGKEKRESEAMKLLENDHKQKTAMELLEQYLQFKQETEKETKKTKKERDPLKPKQPMSAFFLFSNERRAALLAENKNVLEVAKMTGEEWKNMTEEQRGPYEEMAKKNKEKYMQEMEVYKQKKKEEALNLRKEEEEMMKLQKQEALQLLKKKEKTENIIKKTKEKRQKKKKQQQNSDPNKPKKPASSFLLFSKETRKTLIQERQGINNSTINALISVKWKVWYYLKHHFWFFNLNYGSLLGLFFCFNFLGYRNLVRKRRIVGMPKQLKPWKHTRKNWKEEEEMMKLQKQEALQLLKKKEKTENIIKKTKEKRQKKKKQQQNSDPNKPKKPASSFLLFSKETRKTLIQERQGINNSTINALISVKWKELSEEEKNSWNAKAAEAMEAYKKELEEYKSTAAAAEENKLQQ